MDYAKNQQIFTQSQEQQLVDSTCFWCLFGLR